MKKNLANSFKTMSEQETLFFDNPLMQQILSRKDVAAIFRKSEAWVTRMMACGKLTPHYVGATPMFYSDEILQAFLNDSLDQQRRKHDKKKNEQRWDEKVSRSSYHKRKKDITDMRIARRSQKLA